MLRGTAELLALSGSDFIPQCWLLAMAFDDQELIRKWEGLLAQGGVFRNG